MPEMWIRQAGTSGGDDDGSHDGRYMRNVSPAGCYAGGNEFYTVAGMTLGHIKLLGLTDCHADYAHWLRFRLNLDQDANIDIIEARLQLHWNPKLNLDPEHPNRPANVNISTGEKLRINIGVYDSDDAPYPTSAADARTKADSITNWQLWSDETLDNDEGRYVEQVESVSFCEIDVTELIEDATILRSGWSKNNHVLIFLESDNIPGDVTRTASFRTWSWLKWYIGTGELDADEIDTAPILYINYNYNTPGQDYGAHVEHEFELVQSIQGFNTTLPPIEDELEIIQEITVAREYGRSIEQEIEFEQLVKYIETYELEQIDYILLEQWVTATLGDDTLDNAGVLHDLEIEQTVDRNVILNLSVEDTLVFEQDIWKNINEYTVVQELEFTQTIEVDTGSAFSRNVEHTLAFTQDLSFSGSFSRELEQVIPMVQVFTGYLEGTEVTGVCDRKDLLYSPTGDFPSEPVLVPQGQMVLEFPVYAPTKSVTLPQPLLSNQEELNKTRVQRKTRAGELITYVDPDWPDSTTFRFKFDVLTDQEKVDLFDLVATSLAQEVKLTDHEGRIWSGVISNPNGEFTQVFSECGHTAEFDFQVVNKFGGEQYLLDSEVFIDPESTFGVAGARDFNGTLFEHFIAPTPFNPGTNDFWVSFYMYIDNLPGVNGIHTFIATGGGSGGHDGFWVHTLSSGQAMTITLCDTVVTDNYARVRSNVNLKEGQFYHIAINVDRDDTAYIYLNAVQSATTASDDPISDHTGDLGSAKTEMFMGAWTGATHALYGRMCRIGMGTGLLTDTEIKELFNYGNGKTYDELSAGIQAKTSYYYNGLEPSGTLYDSVDSNDGVDYNTVTSIAGPRQSTVADVSGNNRHGYLTEFYDFTACWVRDGEGYFLDFNDFYEEWVTIPYPGFDPKELTYHIRFKVTDETNTHTLAAWGDYRWMLRITSGAVQGYINATTAGDADSKTNAIISKDTWYDVTMRYRETGYGSEGDARKVYLYVNGVEVTYAYQTPATDPPGSVNGVDLLLGQLYPPPTSPLYPMDGGIAQFKLFDVALSDAQIATLPNDGNPITPAIHMEFDDGPQAASVNEGDLITSWESRDGRGNRDTFSQNSISLRPVLDNINGVLAPSFSGTQYLFTLNRVYTGTSGTLILVAQFDNPASTDYATSNSDRRSYSHASFGSYGGYLSFAHEKLSNHVIRGSTLLPTTPVIAVLTGSGSTWKMRLNKVEQTLVSVSGSNVGLWFDQMNLLYTNIGARTSRAPGSETNFMDGKIGMIAHFNNEVLADAVIEEIEDYLAQLFGIDV